MRRILALLVFILFSSVPCFAFGNVSSTIVDTDGQAWANGTYTWNFVPNGSGPFTHNGAPYDPVPISGTLDATGHFSAEIPGNDAITPSGSHWKGTICSAASGTCYITDLFSFTETPSQTITITPPGIRVSALPAVNAYQDAEVSAQRAGQTYFNLTSGTLRVCLSVDPAGAGCTNWEDISTTGGGGGTVPGGTSGDIQFNCLGAFNNADCVSSGAVANIDGSGNITLSSTASGLENIVVGPTGLNLQATDNGATIPISASGLVSIASSAGAVTVNGHTDASLSASTGAANIAGNTAINFTSPNLNTSLGELDLGGVGAGGVLGLKGSTSGKCTFTPNATSTSLSSSCTLPTSSPSFPQTVAGTVVSGGLPYFNSTTQMSSSALQTSGSPILGGGAGAAPATQTFLTTDGISTLNVGVAGASTDGAINLIGKTSGNAKIAVDDSTSTLQLYGTRATLLGGQLTLGANGSGAGLLTIKGSTSGSFTATPSAISDTLTLNGTLIAPAYTCGVASTTSCVFTGFGSTSGSATITWPAVSGTTTNAITFSNAIQTATSVVAGTSIFAGQSNSVGINGRSQFRSTADGIASINANANGIGAQTQVVLGLIGNATNPEFNISGLNVDIRRGDGTTGGGSFSVNGGSPVKGILSATATLDFANQAAIGCNDLTMSVTGAAVGDTVAIGVPNESVPNGTAIFSGWVSATNTVTVRYCNLVSGDPASGTFRATVTQF